MQSTCRRCEKSYVYDRGKGHRKTICNSCNVVIARQRQKERAVEHMGGCCFICGYKKHHNALEFHHQDSEEKDFNLALGGYCRSWERVLKELEKCIMVCSNCHREIHAGLYSELWVQSKTDRHWSEFRVSNKNRRFQHGTSTGYNYHKCRCAECKEHHRLRNLKYRRERRERNS